MLYDYDFTSKIIDIPLGTSSILVQTLYSDIKDAEATVQGIAYGQIASASGNESLGGGVTVGVTVNLLDDWQIRFATGNYIAKVSGGNLVGGLNGDPVAYSNGVQVLLIQSAASTIVTTVTGDGVLASEQGAKLDAAVSAAQSALTQASLAVTMLTDMPTGSASLTVEQSAQLASAATQATIARKMQTNKAVISGDGLSVSLYEDDGVTLLHTFSTPDVNIRIPV